VRQMRCTTSNQAYYEEGFLTPGFVVRGGRQFFFLAGRVAGSND
jgi:hypothetical protein